MLTKNEKEEIRLIVERALDRAEFIWGRHGIALDEQYRADSVAKRERVLSRIPGQKEVEAGKEQVGTYIALVADVRESSKHLMTAIANTKASELERVFYETSALLPALEKTIQFQGGAVTEYLGDGLLALFAVNESDKGKTVRAAYGAAKNCLGNTRTIVNEALQCRYRLPPLDFGIGLAMSRGVVSLVGLDGNSHAKVTGRCVYFASKLAGGRNEIVVDEHMDTAWPTSKGGRLRFERCHRRGTPGYVVTKISLE